MASTNSHRRGLKNSIAHTSGIHPVLLGNWQANAERRGDGESRSDQRICNFVSWQALNAMTRTGANDTFARPPVDLGGVPAAHAGLGCGQASPA